MSSFVIKTNGEQENRIVEEYRDVGRGKEDRRKDRVGAERGRGGRDGEWGGPGRGCRVQQIRRPLGLLKL